MLSVAMKQKAIERFAHRQNHIPHLIDRFRGMICSIPKVNNIDLHAGSAMLFMCEHCGWPTAILDEEYFHAHDSTKIPKSCLSCQDLARMGWLEDAKRQVREASTARD